MFVLLGPLPWLEPVKPFPRYKPSPRNTYLNYTANVNQTYPSGTDTNYMASMANNNGIKYVFRGDGLYLGNGLTGSNQGGGPSNNNIHLNTNGTVNSKSLTVNGASSPVTINHTGGACLSLVRSGKSINFNANYGAGNSYGKMDISSGMALRFAIAGSDKVQMDSSGNWTPVSDNARNLGTSSLRWENIYSADIHCSNKGSKNDVDGTWGDYTIQEGESDLFLINNRSGKKYKFNLTEVN